MKAIGAMPDHYWGTPEPIPSPVLAPSCDKKGRDAEGCPSHNAPAHVCITASWFAFGDVISGFEKAMTPEKEAAIAAKKAAEAAARAKAREEREAIRKAAADKARAESRAANERERQMRAEIARKNKEEFLKNKKAVAAAKDPGSPDARKAAKLRYYQKTKALRKAREAHKRELRRMELQSTIPEGFVKMATIKTVNIGHNALWQAANKGAFPVFKLNRHWYADKKAVEEYDRTAPERRSTSSAATLVAARAARAKNRAGKGVA